MKTKQIAIIGGGPAGCTLATLLHRQGHKVAIFNDSKKTDLFVGESLIPAIIPVLQELGIEEKVKEFSVYKPGATVWVKEGLYAEASFGGGMGTLPSYAYNTNRKKFDELLLQTAVDEGVQLFEFKAGVVATGDKISLEDTTLDQCNGFFDDQPDFIVDASGRRRVISNLLKLPSTKGKRMDTALFTHVEEREFKENYGDIHMHLATRGWCWRIPLPGKTSVGIVINKDTLDTFGKTSEEQFDNYIAQDPKIKFFFEGVKRTSGIQKYSNYQMQSNRIVGENWALVGDAAGFLDPVFSSGLYFSTKYASELAKAIDENSSTTLKSFQKEWQKELNSWKEMIDLWYNGRLFTNFLMGNDRLHTFMGKRIGKHAIKHFTAIFTGEAVKNRYSMWLLKFMTGPLLNFMYFFRMHRYKVKDLEL
ncbi:MAG: NAD(P)/FAD-dependent oxidoreductase [Crocinitomicaceae bacterium]|nr:NAD(P)/FAD-dependent oxidoreductase [Crocinitomicaceae bacterium]